MSPRRRTDDGFALLEVLVALTLLAVGLVAVLTSALAALDLQKDSAMRTRAGFILRDKLAETQLAPYGGETVRGVSTDGRFEWSIVGVPWSGDARNDADGRGGVAVYEVVVDVAWMEDGSPRSVAATQLVTVAAGAGGRP